MHWRNNEANPKYDTQGICEFSYGECEMKYNRHKRGYFHNYRKRCHEEGDMPPFKGFGRRVYSYYDNGTPKYTARPKQKGACRVPISIAIMTREMWKCKREHPERFMLK